MTSIELDRRDGVALITLSRPDRLNAFTPRMVDEMHAILDDLATDVATRVVVLTGEGRAFTSGMDIQAGAEAETEEGKVQRLYRGLRRSSEMVVKLREIPQPVIAALHGPAVGMGVSLALACDLRVADPSARFLMPFLKLGFSAGDLGLTWLLPRLIGTSRASEIFYRARPIGAAEAESLGLLAELADEGKDVEVALALAAELLAKSPFGLRHTKELLNLSLDAPGLRHQMAVEDRTQALAFLTEDLTEGLIATMEKREPHFRNK